MINMPSTSATLLAELEKSALAGDPTARMVLEHPITGLLLKELIETPIPAYIRFDVPHTGLILKDNKRRIIHGYASVETIDKQQELVTIDALKKAWDRMKTAGEKYANINLEHSNITVGKVLLDETVEDSQGQKYWSHVDDKGLYIVAELRDDIEIADRVWAMANKGDLNAYSIGGRALKKRLVSKGGQSFFQIDDLELYEVTICKRGKNELSGFEVLKSYLDNGLIDEATFLQKSAELKKGETLIKELTFLPNLMGKQMILRKEFICQIGSSAEKGEGHDFDLLVKMDVDNPLRRHIETRILKALPPELWDKCEFVFGDEGGPHDTYRPLFDLALIPVDNFSRVEMAKSETSSPSTEQSAEQSSRTLKNIEERKSTVEKPMSAEVEKTIGTPGLVGTATGPQTGGATGTSKEGEQIASLQARVKKLEDQLAAKEAAEKKPEEEEKGKKDKYPYPAEKEAGEKKPPYPPEKEAGKKPPYPEEKEAGDKKKYPYPEEKEASEGEVDPEVFAALEGLETKGKLPEGLRRWMEERRKKTKKGDEDTRISAVEAELKKTNEKLDTLLSAVSKSDKGLSEDDVKKVAQQTAEILKSASPTIKKSAATPSVTPEGTSEEKKTTLQDLHNMSWKDIEDIEAKRRASLLGR